MKHEKKLKLFRKELDLLNNLDAEKFTIAGLMEAPEYFWTVPSSLRYHPKDERKKHGRVLHAKRVARLAHSMAVMMQLSTSQTDAMIVAAILHDICARGVKDEPTSDKALKDHGELAVAHLSWKLPVVMDAYSVRAWHPLAIRLILTHMGKYGPENLKPMTDLEWLFHYVDAMAAKDFVKVQPL